MSPEPRDFPRGGGRRCKIGVCTGSFESCKSYPLDPGTAAYITDRIISESTRNNSNQDLLFNFKLSIVLDVPSPVRRLIFPLGKRKGAV